MPSELSFSRLVPDPDGGSRFETVKIPVTRQDFAPPAQPFSVSLLTSAEECGFLHLPVGWHGEMEFEASDGGKRYIRAGSGLLLEETTGRGHVSRVLGDKAATLAVVRLPGT